MRPAAPRPARRLSPFFAICTCITTITACEHFIKLIRLGWDGGRCCAEHTVLLTPWLHQPLLRSLTLPSGCQLKSGEINCVFVLCLLHKLTSETCHVRSLETAESQTSPCDERALETASCCVRHMFLILRTKTRCS